MPSNTFNRLNASKKSAFLHAAYLEFSHHNFESSSLTSIVARLGIAKGSIYQYFSNKEDLYVFLVDEALRQRHEVLGILGQKQFGTQDEFNFESLIIYLKFSLAFPDLAGILRQAFNELHVFKRESFKWIFIKKELKFFSDLLSNCTPAAPAPQLPIFTVVFLETAFEKFVQQFSLHDVWKKDSISGNLIVSNSEIIDFAKMLQTRGS